MSDRERKRVKRKQRKARSARKEAEAARAEETPEEPEPEPELEEVDEAATTNGASPADIAPEHDEEDPFDLGAEAKRRGISKSELKNEMAREQLEPLAPDERPLVVTLGAILSIAICLFTAGAWIIGAEVDGERPAAFQAFAPAFLFGAMAIGMWMKRYWAVLGFQAVMAILMIGAFLTLIAAGDWLTAVTGLLTLTVAGIFFWFTVKAMARIQMPDKHMPR